MCKKITTGETIHVNGYGDINMDQAWEMALNFQTNGELKKAVYLYNIFNKLFSKHPAVRPFVGAKASKLHNCEDAIPFINRSLKLYNNLGVAYRNLNRINEAMAIYEKALVLDNEHPVINYNLGCILADLGNDESAISRLRIAAHKMTSSRGRRQYSECLGRLRFPIIREEIYDDLVQALQESWTRPTNLLGCVISLLKSDKYFSTIIEFSRTANTEPWQLAEHDSFIHFICDELFIKILQVSYIADADIECFLTKARRYLLDYCINRSYVLYEKKLTRFSVALSINCFINEYTFHETEEDGENVGILWERIIENINNKAISSLELSVVASYRPLFKLSGACKLLDLRLDKQMSPVIDMQLRKPINDHAIYPKIHKFGSIIDKVSKQVSLQYEENPYPRWVETSITDQPQNFGEWFRKTHSPKLTEFSGDSTRKLSILVAGCGTGQQSIEIANMFKNTKCLAVDLSLSSLAYAIRKSNEYGIKNIDYYQADILELGKLDYRFDVIFSSGVLHHLTDPLKGWRVLTQLLRPKGLMFISLYSLHARQELDKVRSFIKSSKYTASDSDMRSFRKNILTMDRSNAIYKEATRWNDFYSLSETRDLFFHSMEHQFTIPEIKECINSLGLQFVCFDIPSKLKNLYNVRFPDNNEANYLDNWHQLELENKNIFSEMYNFWVYKPDP